MDRVRGRGWVAGMGERLRERERESVIEGQIE